jgi:hypothetical protein
MRSVLIERNKQREVNRQKRKKEERKKEDRLAATK